MKKLVFLMMALAGMASTACAQSLEEARQLMKGGAYAEAQEMLDYLIASSKSSNYATLNLLAAECAAKCGENDARLNYLNKAAKRGSAEAFLQLGRIALADYDFTKARENFNKYVSLRSKAGEDASEGEEALAGIAAAQDMLDRVEQIEVIDSLVVPLNSLVQNLAIAPESGRFFTDEDGNTGFVSADSRLRYTVRTDSTDYPRIYEQTLLLDGTYDAPVPIFEGVNSSYPFMMTDGCTFYFASQREGGLGGLDIYRSNRDSEDASFMGAVNMGMPYNSPANDYLLAIDEYSGLGWLVSDRGREGEGVATIYVFLPNEVRRNYDPDSTENLLALARLSDISLTREPGKDYSEYLQKIDDLRRREPVQKSDLSFEMPDGRIITSFANNSQRHAVKEYNNARQEYLQAVEHLQNLYSQFRRNPVDSLRPDIFEAEADCDRLGALSRELYQKATEILSK